MNGETFLSEFYSNNFRNSTSHTCTSAASPVASACMGMLGLLLCCTILAMSRITSFPWHSFYNNPVIYQCPLFTKILKPVY